MQPTGTFISVRLRPRRVRFARTHTRCGFFSSPLFSVCVGRCVPVCVLASWWRPLFCNKYKRERTCAPNRPPSRIVRWNFKLENCTNTARTQPSHVHTHTQTETSTLSRPTHTYSLGQITALVCSGEQQQHTVSSNAWPLRQRRSGSSSSSD